MDGANASRSVQELIKDPSMLVFAVNNFDLIYGELKSRYSLGVPYLIFGNYQNTYGRESKTTPLDGSVFLKLLLMEVIMTMKTVTLMMVSIERIKITKMTLTLAAALGHLHRWTFTPLKSWLFSLLNE